jgi:hypothetical protein
MIRFIDLGKQIAVDETDSEWPKQFAFFDTIVDQFVSINGYVVFDSLEDVMMEIKAEDMSLASMERILGLIPDWVRKSNA